MKIGIIALIVAMSALTFAVGMSPPRDSPGSIFCFVMCGFSLGIAYAIWRDKP